MRNPRVSPAHPEQVVGNVWSSVMMLKKLGISVTKRPQAVGSAVVGALKGEGYYILQSHQYHKAKEQVSALIEALGERDAAIHIMGENIRLRQELEKLGYYEKDSVTQELYGSLVNDPERLASAD